MKTVVSSILERTQFSPTVNFQWAQWKLGRNLDMRVFCLACETLRNFVTFFNPEIKLLENIHFKFLVTALIICSNWYASASFLTHFRWFLIIFRLLTSKILIREKSLLRDASLLIFFLPWSSGLSISLYMEVHTGLRVCTVVCTHHRAILWQIALI